MKICFPDFTKGRILVVGDLMLDRYWHGSTSRISPEAPVPVVKVNQIEERPGGAGNVAMNIASLGGKVCLLGLTGKDNDAEHLKNGLDHENIECHFVELEDVPTITKLRVISRQQQLIRMDFEETFYQTGQQRLLKLFKKHIMQCDTVIFSDYAKGTLSDVSELIHIAKSQKKTILVDPKGSDFSKYNGASLVTPNFSEFELVVGESKSEAEISKNAEALMETHDWPSLLVTRGEQGMTLFQAGKKEVHLPAEAREVFDVTGAGDTVIATLGAALASGDDIESAVALANTAAGIVVGKLGTASVSALELRQKVLVNDELSKGVFNKEQLSLLVDVAKEKGEVIVMTNGCFDILHAGHVAYLRQAKSLGQRLIVAVNDDASVKRLKGEGRPVNPVDRRMTVLAALGCVDWVVPFGEDTPAELIESVLPDILVKGGDYKAEDVAGGEAVIANGGKVSILSFVNGVSTTQMIDQILSKK